MFTVSAKGIYGLTAVVSLADQPNRTAVQIKTIAEAHGIPQHYLEQILVILKKAGIVESFRGARGGYALAKQPSSIRIIDVLSQLEGGLSIVPEGQHSDMLDFFWADLQDVLGEKLSMTIDDLLLERDRTRNSFTYTI